MRQAALVAYLNNVKRRRRQGPVLAPLRVAGTPVLTATQGQPYDGFTVSATGGREPYAFAVQSGALPGGITIDDETGEVAGTPTVAGEFADIVLGVTDSDGATASLDPFTLTVGAA